jgi:hypothetical protein
MGTLVQISVIERFADPIVSLPPDSFRKREPVHLRSAITGKIGSPVTIRQAQATSEATIKAIVVADVRLSLRLRSKLSDRRNKRTGNASIRPRDRKFTTGTL